MIINVDNHWVLILQMLSLSMGNSNKIKVAILLLNDDDLRHLYND